MIVCPECGHDVAQSIRERVTHMPRLLKVSCDCRGLDITYEHHSGEVWRVDLVMSFRPNVGPFSYCTDLVSRHVRVEGTTDYEPDRFPTLEAFGAAFEEDLLVWFVAGVLDS